MDDSVDDAFNEPQADRGQGSLASASSPSPPPPQFSSNNPFWRHAHHYGATTFGRSQSSPLPEQQTRDSQSQNTLSLSEYFQLGEEPRTAYNDAECLEIARLLRESGRGNYAAIPRIYIILRNIGQLRAIASFIEGGIDDMWLPIAQYDLPHTLPAIAKQKFLDTQGMVLTKAFNLERGTAKQKHANFRRNESFPFEMLGELGHGAYASVHKVRSATTGEFYATKRFRRMQTNNRKGDVQKFKNELEIMKKINHIHCVQLVASYTDPKYFGIIMSPVADCNLVTFYHESLLDTTKTTLLRSFFGCLANGLSYLHQNTIRHRDIKPANILVRQNKAYLADFGISLDWQDLSGSTTTRDTAKTWVYCAPEVANYEPRNTSSDIWSLGCVFLEMYTVLKGVAVHSLREHLDMTGNEQFFRNSSSVEGWMERLRSTEPVSDEFLPILITQFMLRKDPHERISAHVLHQKIARRSSNSRGAGELFCGECCLDCAESSMDDESDSITSGEAQDDEVFTLPTSTTAELPQEPVSSEPLDDTSTTEKLSSSATMSNLALSVEPGINSTLQLQEMSSQSLQKEPTQPTSLFSGHLPEISANSWQKPRRLLDAIRHDKRFIKYLEENYHSEYLFIHEATMKDVPAILRLLLQAGLNPNDPKFIGSMPGEEGACPHLWVLQPDWTDHFEPTGIDGPFSLLCNSGANIHDYQMKNGRTALTRASGFGLLATVQDIIDRGGDVNKRIPFASPVQRATIVGKLDIVQCLVDNKANFEKATKYGPSCLLLAAKYGHLDIMKYLAQKGANFAAKWPDYMGPVSHTPDSAEATILMVAANNGHNEIVEYLLEEHGADVKINEQNVRGTVLRYAVYSPSTTANKVRMIELLFKHGADPNLIGSAYGRIALHTASELGIVEVIQVLIRNGSMIEAKDVDNITPLLRAAWNGRFEAVKLLLAYGADPNPNGKLPFRSTALTLAKKTTHKELIAFLKNYKK